MIVVGGRAQRPSLFGRRECIELSSIALACIAGGIGLLIVALAYLHSCHAQEVAWLQRKLRELAEENAKLKEEVKREVSLPAL